MGSGVVHVFQDATEAGDAELLAGFGAEWTKFRSLSEKDLRTAGGELFDLLPTEGLGPSATVLDVGCGNGRWSRYLIDRVGHIDAIDPSRSVLSAAGLVGGDRIRWSMARAENLPFNADSFDLVLCIGVLHHVQEPMRALKESLRVMRPGASFYVYMYYALEQRGRLYRWLFRASDALRRVIHRLPGPLKRGSCEVIAVLVYLPMVFLVRSLKHLGWSSWRRFPLAYYHDKSFHVMRNDALDRFGTSYEARYTQVQIREMLTEAGFEAVRFSEEPPYWHAIARKPMGR